jgi:sugar/nucleoside kinase (ribokinase family)
LSRGVNIPQFEHWTSSLRPFPPLLRPLDRLFFGISFLFREIGGGSLLLTSCCRPDSEHWDSTMDILVCGNPTIDELVQNGRVCASPGGSALFASCAAGYLGSRVGILGNIGEDYPPRVLRRLKTLHIDIRLLKKSKGPSTRFQITRTNGSRKLRLLESGEQIAAPAGSHHFQGVHMGPVFNEIPSSLIATLRKRCDFLSVDLQGFIRTVSANGAVRTVPRSLSRLIGQCDMVQASIDEARSQTRSRDPRAILNRFLTMGAYFAIVTMGEKGSWLGSRRNGPFFIPAFPDRRIRDSTGAGDVYAGSWLSTYLSTKDPTWGSSVGSAFASLASRQSGLSKFRISWIELFRRAVWVYNHIEMSPD